MKKIVILSACGIATSFACTTFATFNGADGTLLMAKNRDNNPDRQVIEVVAEKGKLKYLALSRQDVPDFVSAGINEKNLAVFNEVTVEYSTLAKGGIADDFSKGILQNYTNAKDVIPDLPKLIAKFPDPVFYQVADAKNILSIEVAPNHKFSYKLVDRGVYAHTNNYQDEKLIKNYPYTSTENVRLLASTTRLNRALYLAAQESSNSLQAMQNIALDQSAGTDDSIFRLGNIQNYRSSKSLAFFGVKIDKAGRNPGEFSANLYYAGEKYNYVLNQQFWDKYNQQYTVVSATGK